MAVEQPQSRLMSLLDIRAGEQRIVGLLLLHSLFYGATVSLAYTAAIAIFLQAYSAAQLPWVYIAAAVIIILTGTLYSWLSRRLAFGPLFLLTLGFLVVSGVALRIGIQLSNAAWLAFVTLIWFRLLFNLTGLEFWGVAGRLLTLQQGKRLFGLIGAGEVLAKVLGYSLVPLLVAIIGTTNLLVLAAGMIAGSMVTLVLLLRSKGESAEIKPHVTPVRSQQRNSANTASLRQRYIQLIAISSLLSMLLYFLVDFGFLQQVREQYTDADALATFLGIFSSVAYGGGFIMRTFLTSRLLKRFGLRIGIVLLPVLLLIPLVLVSLFGALGIMASVVFWSMAAARLFNDLLRNGIYRSSFVLLYQPLNRQARLAAQTAAESMFEPVGIALAGIALLVFNALPGFSLAELGYLMLALTAVWVLVTVWTYREYLASLRKALSMRSFEVESLDVSDSATTAAILRTLESGRASEIVYAIELLGTTGMQLTETQFRRLLQHDDAAVRTTALGQVEKQLLTPVLDRVITMALDDPHSTVRAAALRAWTALDPPEALQALLPYLESEDELQRQAVLIALLRHGGISGVLASGSHLLQMTSSEEPAVRVTAANVLSQVEVNGYYQPLLPLLADDNRSVVRAALYAAGTVNSSRLWPLVVDELRSPEVGRAAAAALERGGNSILPYIEKVIADPDTSRGVRARLAHVMGRIGTPETVTMLRAFVDAPDQALRTQVLRSLSHIESGLTSNERAQVEAQLSAEAAGAYQILVASEALVDNDILVRALLYDLQQAINRMFYLLMLLYDHKALRRAQNTLYFAAAERRGYALELIDNLLSQAHKRLLLPFIDDLSVTQRVQQLRSALPSDVLATDSSHFLTDYCNPHLSDWTKACAVYTIESIGVDSAEFTPTHRRNVLGAALNAPQPMVAEAAAWMSQTHTHQPQQTTVVRGKHAMLSTLEKVIILKTVEIFQQTSDPILAEIAQLLEEVNVEAGEPIFAYGDPGSSLYIVVTGRVRAHIGEKELNFIGEREVFGEMAILDPAPRMASITAVEESLLLVLEQEPLFELMESRSEVSRGMMQVVIRRLRDRVNDLNAMRDEIQRLSATAGAN